MKAFVVRADDGNFAEAFQNNGYAGIGWFSENIDDFGRETIANRYRQVYPQKKAGNIRQNTGQIFRFLNEINLGDILITPTRKGQLLVGKVNGKPYFKKDKTTRYFFRIPVKWNTSFVDRQALSVPLQNTLKSSLTVFNVSQVEEIAAASKFKGFRASPETVSETPINRSSVYQLIKKQFLQLSPFEFEQLVASVLQSLGFEATQKTGKSGDGGIDFEGTLDTMGLAKTKLQVQVKRYARSRINEKEIRSFRGALKKGYQGTFITLSSFQKKARQSASSSDFSVTINLINGNQFIDIFIEQYDKVMDILYQEENVELLARLKFKKALIPEAL